MGSFVPLRENRRVRLVARPRGIPQAEQLLLATEPVAAPGQGAILIKNRYLEHAPGTIARLYRADNNGKPIIAADQAAGT